MEGKKSYPSVVWTEWFEHLYVVNITSKVAMGEENPFWFPRGSRGINKGCRIVRGKRRKERRLFTSLCNNLLPCFNERCEVVEAFILDEKLAVIGKEKVFLVFKDSFLNFFGEDAEG